MSKLNSKINILLVLVAIGVVGVAGSQMGYLSFGESSDNGNKDTTTYSFDEGTINFRAKESKANSLTYVSGADYHIYNSNGNEVASGSLSGDNYSQFKQANPGETYTVKMIDDDGTGSDYYLGSFEIKADAKNKYKTAELKEEGSVTMAVEETSGSADNDDTIKLTSGGSETVTLKLEGGTQNTFFNQPAVFWKTDAPGAIDEVQVVDDSGNVKSTVTMPDRLNTKSYQAGYETGITEIVGTSKKSLNLKVVADGNTDPANANVTVLTADRANYQDSAGDFLLGFQDDSDADVGSADATHVLNVQ